VHRSTSRADLSLSEVRRIALGAQGFDRPRPGGRVDARHLRRTIHQLGLSASYTTGRFIPGILFRVPMDDDLSEILDFVFGINVGYRLP